MLEFIVPKYKICKDVFDLQYIRGLYSGVSDTN